MNKLTKYLLGSIVLNNPKDKLAAIRKDDLNDLYKAYCEKNGKDTDKERFPRIISSLVEEKLISFNSRIVGNSPELIMIEERVVSDLRNSLSGSFILKEIIGNTIFLNHYINFAALTYNTYPHLMSSQAAELPGNSKSIKAGFRMVRRIANKMDVLGWSELNFTEFADGNLKYAVHKGSTLFKLYKVLCSFIYWIRSDLFLMKDLSLSFQKIQVEDYTSDFVSSSQYRYVMETLKPFISNADNLADQHFRKLQTMEQYYYFLKSWKVVVGDERLKVLANHHKEHILANIIEEAINEEDKLAGYLKKVQVLSEYLGWENELKELIDNLNIRLNNYATSLFCNACNNKTMILTEYSLVCTNCGFSRLI